MNSNFLKILRLGNSLNNNSIHNKSLLNNCSNSNGFNLGIGLGSNVQPYGTIKRSSSSKINTDNIGPNDRPSTAPQKNNKPDERGLNPNNSLKRLPSPNVKCKIL